MKRLALPWQTCARSCTAQRILKGNSHGYLGKTLPAGSETGHHTHQYDYVVVYLTDGILTVITPNGELVEAPVKQHALTSRPAGVSHNVMNNSGSLIQFIEIELK